MAILQIPAFLLAAATALAAAEPALDQAEVRIPYGELRRLIEAGRDHDPGPARLDPALLSARISLSLDGSVPVIDTRFRTVRFNDGFSLVPLLGGAVTLDQHDPADARLVVRGKMLCHVGDTAGTSEITARLLATETGGSFQLELPPCPATILETGELPARSGVVVSYGEQQHTLAAGQRLALPPDAGTLGIRLLSGDETREALRPPEPSAWSWQHQALVTPADAELVYHVLAHASAPGGSGLDATLLLPPDARGVQVTGADLAASRPTRDADGAQRLRIEWASRAVLDRDVEIHYRVPLRPLDANWQLATPAGQTETPTRTRFLIAASHHLAYQADGLAGPFPSESAPATLARELAGRTCFHLEGTDRATLAVRRLPVVATADAVIENAAWSLRIEPDGAMLAEGTLLIEHRGPQRVRLDTPQGMSLLACHVDGSPVEPVDLGDGGIEIALPAPAEPAKGPTSLACSFTGRSEAIDPIEGTLALALPRTPLFIRALDWCVVLPQGYRAEIHGNLTREAGKPDSPASTLFLHKNLCRDEVPDVRVFYQRADLLP